MGWNGSGAFTRVFGSTGWTDDKNASVNILSSRHDTHDNDIANGINICLTNDNQSKPAADFKPNLDNSYDVGSIALGWKSLFLRTLKLINSGFTSSLTTATLTANRTITFPDANVTIPSSFAPVPFALYNAIKTATTTRNNTTTYADDPHLILALPAGTFDVALWVPFYCPVANGFGVQMRLNFTGTSTLSQFSGFGEVSGTAFQFSTNPIATSLLFSAPIVSASGTNADWVILKGAIVVSVAGNFSLQWSQQVFGAQGVSLSGGAEMIITRIS